MNIDKLTRRNFINLSGSLISTILFSSCIFEPIHDEFEENTKNEAPNTIVTKEIIKDKEEVKYYFSGTDLDGHIDYINVSINGGSFSKFNNGSYCSVPLIFGENKVIAIAVDNKGLADQTPARDSFYFE